MSGHSRWATIKRKKARADAERGKQFSRLIKEVIVAAREGGGDIDGNPRLRSAVASAKAANMPHDNIKRAILKGTGQLPGVSYESATFEGYGPGGAAIYMEVLTDNRNRVIAEIRHILSKYGGNLGANGCVAWMFDKKGVITVELEASDEDTLMEIALEKGAEDIRTDSGAYEILMEPAVLDDVRDALEQKGVRIAAAEVTMIPQNTAPLEKESEASSMLRMIDLLEENDDIQKVYSNFDIDQTLLEKLAG